ncbi:DUF2860 domain-containing protein [Psychromonas sp. Urea-02u-13]|uniref:DUF2860 domain-containing protein n=1 Tax=Psychromonas sp. Urea-02u-13 TaxID=2058326 RepID=UPI000C32BBC2|nr:DUF2860 domain-containing protein [Psychromonas sp. Urea-02u-13]PKG40518.1 hypothetical protein CXF74_02710 [Psychromonas sp. Urea-02u-13]
MSKLLNTILLMASAALVPSTQARPLDKEPGFGLTLAFYAGSRNVESQFTTHEDNEVTNNLTNSGESLQTPIIFPLGRIQYTFDSLQTQVYLGNSQDQVATARFQYELGFIHQFKNQTKITVAYFPELSMFNDTWEDPFLTDQARETTKESTGGGRIAIEQLFGGPFAFKYAYAANDVENETSGSSRTDLTPGDMQSLERDSAFHRAEVEVVIPVTAMIYMRPSLEYTVRNADGEANSYDEYTAQLSVLARQGKHTIVSTISLGMKQFDIINPVFNVKQDSTSLRFFSIYSYKQPFDWESFSFNIMAGYSQEDSDIDFYDESSFIIATGLTYKY